MVQAEAAECGLASIAMVAAHYGHKVNVGGLRRLFPASMRGTTLAALMNIASELELAPRALRLELDELPKLQLPAILHWDVDHFVVLESVGRGKATVLDPAFGRRILTIGEVGRHFTGVALELTPTSAFKPVEARRRTRLSDLWSRLVNYRRAVVQVIALSLLLELTALALPFFLQLTVDEAIGQGDSSLLTLLVVGFAAVYALNALVQGLRSWVVLTLGQSLSYQLVGNVFRHLLRLPMRWFESRHIGDLLSRIGSTQPIQTLLAEGAVSAFVDAALALVTLLVMAMISVPLTLAVAATTFLYLGFRMLIYPTLKRRTEEEIIARAREETYLMESLRAIRAIKLHVHEAVRENGWRNKYADVISAGYRAQIYRVTARLGENLLIAAQLLLVVWLGARAVIADEMTIGVLLAFLAYRASFMLAATGLVEQAERWRLLSVHLDRLSDIVSEPREPSLPALPRTHTAPPPAIRGEGIEFAYGPHDPPVLRDLNFDIPAGAFVAIIGASGAGKTTLMRILLGLMEPTAGRMLVDGRLLSSASAPAWRARIGAVLQDDQLLSGTLADNIAFFDERPSEEGIEMAARLARIHDTIAQMPMGYQSLVGDMGAALSSGQRQRIILARALYRDPDALFLDEGTANLDEENEKAIAETIARLAVTRIVISHRPLLVERAEIVLRLTDGRLEPVERTRRGEPSVVERLRAIAPTLVRPV
jgi:ATP-binding cassette subfamily B protein RaxB